MTDLSQGETSSEGVLTAYLQAEASRPFDLVEGPPIRARLFKLSDASHALVLTAHHIICDGWSINVIITELAEIYASLRERRQPDLGPVLPFSEYARAQSVRAPQEQAANASYWAEQFAKPVRPIDLPTDRPRPAMKSYAGATAGRRIEAPLYRDVKATGAKQGCSLFVTLLAAFEALMGRLAGVEELVVAVPTAGQSLVEDQALVGHCVNFLPIRGAWERETSFADHLRSVGRQVLDAYEHQDYHVGHDRAGACASTRGQPASADGTPIQPRAAGKPDRSRRTVDRRRAERQGVRELRYFLERHRVRRTACASIATTTPTCSTKRRLFAGSRAMRRCSSRWLRTPTSPSPEFLTSPVAICIRSSRGSTTAAKTIRAAQCVHALIEEQARATPGAVALAFDDAIVSYQELDARANRLAHHLNAQFGSDGGRIGVLVERSPDMVIALLAIWKAGFAYVPLDPTHPQARLRYILSDADVTGVVSSLAEELELPSNISSCRADVGAAGDPEQASSGARRQDEC